MIVKNEEDVLARALTCAKKFADEIIVADTGSTDKTVNIAKSFGSKVYIYEWTDDFSAARNFAFEKATCDYVMWLDADDAISGDNCQKIIALKPLLDKADIWYMKYATAFDKDGKPTFEYWRERVFRLDRPRTRSILRRGHAGIFFRYGKTRKTARFPEAKKPGYLS